MHQPSATHRTASTGCKEDAAAGWEVRTMSASRLLPEETIRQVLAANDIVEVVGACVPLKKTGATFTALCLFHKEKSPSFTVTPARQSFKCFGCGAGGDVIAFQMLHEGVGFTDAVHHLAQRAGIPLEVGSTCMGIPIDPKPMPKPRRVLEPARVLKLPPDLHCGSRLELRAVAERRGLAVAGVELASDRGLVVFGTSCGVPSWIVTDVARVNAQSRRMDGRSFPTFGELGERKAHTLGGSRAAWPVGTREAEGMRVVALVEGGPDLLAAYHFIVAEGREADTAAIALLGAANDIPEDALLLLANKRVRIFPHLDAAGREAALRWTRQLERVGCEVDAFAFDGLRRSDGGAVSDLNDLAQLDADDFEAERAELERILPQ